MNYIWSGFILVSIFISLINGNISKTQAAAMEGAKETVEMILSLAGIICFWTGMMEIAVRSGGVKKISKLLKPVVKFLFPDVKSQKAKDAILMNMTANILGIGNAATPFGLKAMEELNRENFNKGTATNSMCRFVLINTASIQLIPTTIFALRSSFDSADPFCITGAVWFSSLCALCVGLILIKFMERKI